MAIVTNRVIKVFNKTTGFFELIPYIDASDFFPLSAFNVTSPTTSVSVIDETIGGLQVRRAETNLRITADYNAYLPEHIEPLPLSVFNMVKGVKKDLLDIDFAVYQPMEGSYQINNPFVGTLAYNGNSTLVYNKGDTLLAYALVCDFDTSTIMFNNVNNIGIVFADINVGNPLRKVFTILLIDLETRLILNPRNRDIFSNATRIRTNAFAPASLLNYNQNYNFITTNLNVREFSFDTDYGSESTPGGYEGGTYDNTSDTIAIPTAPGVSMSSGGFVNIYNVSQTALEVLGRELFPPLPSATDSVAEVLYSIGQSFQNSNLINYVLDCHVIPVAPTTNEATTIKVGYRTIDTSVLKVASDYVDFDCGTLSIGEYFGNFADYGAFTTCKLFLPFIGFVDLKPEYWQSGSINITYRFNVVDGSCMAYVKSSSSKSELTDTVIAQYSGVACLHIPITGVNYSNMVSTAISTGSNVVTSAGSGNFAGASNDLLSLASLSPSVQSSNGYSASSSIMSIRTPYLIIERPVQNFSNLYAHENGIPCNISVYFDELEGFTIATVEHLEGFENALPEEIEDIKKQLAQGVIF